MLKGALSLAEYRPVYKVGCTLFIQNGREKRDFVLRTTFDFFTIWKTKNNNVPTSPFRDTVNAVTKGAAVIVNDVWVFGIDAIKAPDIFTIVKIVMKYHQPTASDIIGDVYVKISIPKIIHR